MKQLLQKQTYSRNVDPLLHSHYLCYLHKWFYNFPKDCLLWPQNMWEVREVISVPGEYRLLWSVHAWSSHKIVFWRKTSACKDGTVKTNQTRLEWHHNAFTPSQHLVPFRHCLQKYATVCHDIVKRQLVYMWCPTICCHSKVEYLLCLSSNPFLLASIKLR